MTRSPIELFWTAKNIWNQTFVLGEWFGVVFSDVVVVVTVIVVVVLFLLVVVGFGVDILLEASLRDV